ncbi:MAG: hypothetical protein ACRDLQ_03270, partial [Solirubrobacterales bacterium]
MSDTLLLVSGRPGRDRGCELRARVVDGARELRLYACPPQSGETAPIRVSVVPLERLLEQDLSPEPDGGRALMAVLLQGAAPELEGPEGLRVAKSLRRIRNAARGELRAPAGEHGAALAVNVDAIKAIDDRAFWVYGWLNNPQGLINKLEAVSPEGQRTELFEHAYRYDRPDVAELHAAAGAYGQRHGFHRYFELPHPSRLRSGWRVELRDAAGDEYRVNAPEDMTDNPPETRLTILREFAHDRPGKEILRTAMGHPALERLQRRLRRTAEIEAVDQHGDAPTSPAVTIIVPLYKR